MHDRINELDSKYPARLNTHTLVGGQKLVGVHRRGDCRGEFCTIHNFSDHHMVTWRQNWRPDRGIMERICEHGVGHPDPDDYGGGTKSAARGIHGCDGCCVDPREDEEWEAFLNRCAVGDFTEADETRAIEEHWWTKDGNLTLAESAKEVLLGMHAMDEV